MQINISNYESLLSAAKQQVEPQRLLFLFLKASLPEDHKQDQENRFHAGQGGELQPIMCVDKTLDELGSFSDLVAEAERMEQDWKIVLIACISGKYGLAPNSDEAELPLKIMTQTVLDGGDLSKYLAFDKEGTLIQFN
ncbi:MAG: hypothetical protein Q7T58_10410 [Methylotenera sp.]|nr:hypothetical protein [Methylotenera sp.]